MILIISSMCLTGLVRKDVTRMEVRVNIQLKEINDSNRIKCIELKVSSTQECFIASNENSLKEAEENPQVARPFAIYAEEKLVGFTMFAFDEDNEDPEDRYWLWRFMIDASFQGKGYGRAALKEIIRYFRECGANEITLSTKEENERALKLYQEAGFQRNGQMNEEEIVLKLYLCRK